MDDLKVPKDGAKSKVDENTKNDKRGRKPGSPKSGGRSKGTPNKKSLWLRDELESVGLSWGKEFKKALDSNDFQKAEILASLLPYLNPKLKEKEKEEQEPSEPQQQQADILSLVNGK